jgi:hypothetical protein
MQRFLIYLFLQTLYMFQAGSSAHHQEHITVQILPLAATVVAVSSSIG